MTPALEARDVSVRRCGRSLVQRVSLYAERGELLALCGPKGGGADTMLELLAGSLAPDQGRLLVDGVTALAGVPRPRDPRLAGSGPCEARALLDADGLVAPVLLLTAPTDGLDDDDADQLLAQCLRRARDGAAVVVTLDDPRRAATFADTVALLVAGRMLGWGSPGVALVPALRLLGVASR